MRLKVIRWLDSRGFRGWAYDSDLDAGAVHVTTLGFIIRESTQDIVVVSTIGAADRHEAIQYHAPITIPKSAILGTEMLDIALSRRTGRLK
jgi:hypothetical protein